MSITSFASGLCTGFILPTAVRLGIGELVQTVLPADVTIRIRCLAALIIPTALSYGTISEDALFDKGYRMGLSASAFFSGQAVGREVVLISTENTHLSNSRQLKEQVLAKLSKPVAFMVTAATIGITHNGPPVAIAYSSTIGMVLGGKITAAILNESQPQ